MGNPIFVMQSMKFSKSSFAIPSNFSLLSASFLFMPLSKVYCIFSQYVWK